MYEREPGCLPLIFFFAFSFLLLFCLFALASDVFMVAHTDNYTVTEEVNFFGQAHMHHHHVLACTYYSHTHIRMHMFVGALFLFAVKVDFLWSCIDCNCH